MRMGRWIAVGTDACSLIVVAVWWFTVSIPWVMDRMELFPLFLVIQLGLGPLTGLGAALCGWLVYLRGWGSVWYAVPCLLLGCTAFVVNGLAFVFLIAPGC